MEFTLTSPTTTYNILGIIGEGTSGVVYRAISLTNNTQNVAIKAIPNEHDNYKWALNEAYVHSHLCHMNIINCFEYWSDDSSFYIAMEYHNGVDLLKYLNSRKKELREEEVRLIMKQLVDCLEYLSGLNCVHRDLKLENIMIDPTDLSVKVFDFGFAEISHEKGEFEGYCGSPTYIAPEILRHEKYTVQADIFSLSVCFYALLHRHIPGSANGLHHVPISAFKIDDHTSEAAKDLLKKMLVEDSYTRISIQEIKKHNFFANEERGPTASKKQNMRASKSSFLYLEPKIFFFDLQPVLIGRSASVDFSVNENVPHVVLPHAGERKSMKPIKPSAIISDNPYAVTADFNFDSLELPIDL